MKTMKILCILFIIIVCSCDNNRIADKDNWGILIKEYIDVADGNEGDQLYLYISDNMCSECIVKELINIKSNEIKINIIGVFNEKRNFLSAVNYPYIKEKIYINKKDIKQKEKLPIRPIYFIYNSVSKSIYEIFYPDPCNEELTYKYMMKTKERI